MIIEAFETKKRPNFSIENVKTVTLSKLDAQQLLGYPIINKIKPKHTRPPNTLLLLT